MKIWWKSKYWIDENLFLFFWKYLIKFQNIQFILWYSFQKYWKFKVRIHLMIWYLKFFRFITFNDQSVIFDNYYVKTQGLLFEPCPIFFVIRLVSKSFLSILFILFCKSNYFYALLNAISTTLWLQSINFVLFLCLFLIIDNS